MYVFYYINVLISISKVLQQVSKKPDFYHVLKKNMRKRFRFRGLFYKEIDLSFIDR